MIMLILYMNLLIFSWINLKKKKCLFLRNMGPLMMFCLHSTKLNEVLSTFSQTERSFVYGLPKQMMFCLCSPIVNDVLSTFSQNEYCFVCSLPKWICLSSPKWMVFCLYSPKTNDFALRSRQNEWWFVLSAFFKTERFFSRSPKINDVLSILFENEHVYDFQNEWSLVYIILKWMSFGLRSFKINNIYF